MLSLYRRFDCVYMIGEGSEERDRSGCVLVDDERCGEDWRQWDIRRKVFMIFRINCR